MRPKLLHLCMDYDCLLHPESDRVPGSGRQYSHPPMLLLQGAVEFPPCKHCATTVHRVSVLIGLLRSFRMTPKVSLNGAEDERSLRGELSMSREGARLSGRPRYDVGDPSHGHVRRRRRNGLPAAVNNSPGAHRPEAFRWPSSMSGRLLQVPGAEAIFGKSGKSNFSRGLIRQQRRSLCLRDELPTPSELQERRVLLLARATRNSPQWR